MYNVHYYKNDNHNFNYTNYNFELNLSKKN